MSRALLAILGLGAAACFAALGMDDAGRDLARGWLCAFVLVAMVPIGSLALLLVHGVSGGRWGADLAPALIPAARATPLLIVAILPVLIFRPLIFDWHGVPEDVARLYLNAPFFDARSLAALAIWSGLAWSNAWRSQATAGLALGLHLLLTSLVPADWVLTIPPGSTSAGFGLGFGIEQILAALAFAALLGRQGPAPRANRDLAGMIVSALLGVIYFGFVQFVITWYGNVPDKVAWYTHREYGLWTQGMLAAFLLGAAVPFLALLSPRVRQSRRALRRIGLLLAAGIAVHVAWLTAAGFGTTTALPAGMAAVFLGVVLIEVARLLPRPRTSSDAPV